VKYLSIIILAIFAISCSSSKKKETAKEMPKAKVSKEKSSKEVPTEQPAAHTGNQMGDFPMITGSTRSEANCSTGSDKRKVTVIDREAEKDCGVVYEKFGNAKTVAMASHEMAFCDRVAANIKRNLANGGLSCDGDQAAATAAPAAQEEAPAVKEGKPEVKTEEAETK